MAARLSVKITDYLIGWLMIKKIIFAVLCASVPGTVGAVDAVLLRVRGTVMVRVAGEKIFEKAAPGAPLLFGDQVKTMAGSMAHILFSEGPTVLIKENSSLTLEGNRQNPQVSFKLGEFLIGLKKKLGSGRTFRVKTPAAVAAVRGTLFWGLSGKDKSSTYACFGSVISIEAQGKTVELKAGQKVVIPFGKAPQETYPAGVPLSYLDTFAVDNSIDGLKDLVDRP